MSILIADAEKHDGEEVTEKPNEVESGEWVKFAESDLGPMLKKLDEALKDQHKTDKYPVFTALRDTGLTFNFIRSSFIGIFNNGLRVDFPPKGQEFFFRIVENPSKHVKNPKLKTPISYELKFKLVPRYSMDGDPGYYNLQFTTYVKDNTATKKYHRGCEIGDKFGVIRTTDYKRSTKKYPQAVESAKEMSVEKWIEIIRKNLQKSFAAQTGGAEV